MGRNTITKKREYKNIFTLCGAVAILVLEQIEEVICKFFHNIHRERRELVRVNFNEPSDQRTHAVVFCIADYIEHVDNKGLDVFADAVFYANVHVLYVVVVIDDDLLKCPACHHFDGQVFIFEDKLYHAFARFQQVLRRLEYAFNTQYINFIL